MKELQNEEINKIEDNPDGSTIYEVGRPQPISNDNSFSKNLALEMSEDMLKSISKYMIECLDEDTEARQPWLDLHKKAEKYIGNDLEDLQNIPFPNANRTFDTTFSNGLIRFCANSSSELLPDGGPCSYKIVGEDRSDLDYIAKVRTAWMNYFLTVVDHSYYQDFSKSLYYLGYYGTMIKKTYYDTVLKKPISRFILPQNFLINIDCTAILESDRLTHILKLSARDVLIKQRDGLYRDVKLPYLKYEDNTVTSDSEVEEDKSESIVSIDGYTKRTLHDVYESHVYICLDAFKKNYDKTKSLDIPKPYIITIDKESTEVLSIIRSWKKDDSNFNRRKYFTGYNYFTGFDIWGLGLARMCGTNAMAVTGMLRQIIDAATFQNLPAWFMQKGTSKQQETNMTIGAGQVKFVDSTGDIRTTMMQVPANGPSQALIDIRRDMISQMQDQLSSSEIGMMDSKEDIPTGTAVAFLEQSNKIQSAVLKSIHNSFSEELRLIDDIFKETLEREEFFLNGEQHIITREHFIDSVQIVPVSDPSANSTVQRIMKAEAAFQAGMQLPDAVNTVELLKMVFKAQGLSEEVIESILVNKQEEEVRPRDPVTENMDLMQNKPVKAGLEQNHDAHIVVHSAVDNELANAHIQEHTAMKFLLQIQQQMGINLNEIEDLENNIEMQNLVAMKAAEAVEALGLNKRGDNEQAGDIDQQLIAADIEQKKEANKIRKEIADMRLEGDVFKAQLHFEEAKEKMKLEKQEVLLKSQIELEKIRKRIGL